MNLRKYMAFLEEIRKNMLMICDVSVTTPSQFRDHFFPLAKGVFFLDDVLCSVKE